MQKKEERIVPKWPLRLVLSLLIVVEILFVVMFVWEGIAQGSAENMPIILNSIGLLLFCVLTWLAIPWSRWLVVAFLVWRVVGIGISLSEHFGDHRTDGSVMLIGFYIVVGLALVSPLGRVRLRAET
jgi:hypothetical protein